MAAGQKKEEEKYFREVVVRVPDSTIIAGAWTAQYTRLDHLREILLEDRGCCRDLSLLLVSVKGAEAGDQRARDKFFICFGVLNVHTIISEDSKAWVQQCERHILQYELRIGLMCSTYKALQNSSVQGKVVKSTRTVFNFGQIQRTSEMTPWNQVWIERSYCCGNQGFKPSSCDEDDTIYLQPQDEVPDLGNFREIQEIGRSFCDHVWTAFTLWLCVDWDFFCFETLDFKGCLSYVQWTQKMSIRYCENSNQWSSPCCLLAGHSWRTEQRVPVSVPLCTLMLLQMLREVLLISHSPSLAENTDCLPHPHHQSRCQNLQTRKT